MLTRIIKTAHPKIQSWMYFKHDGVGPVLPGSTTWKDYIGKTWYNLNGWNKYGLYTHDIIFEWPDIEEAVRRLPDDLAEGRNYRIIRAYQLSIQNIRLPRHEWIPWEEDLQFRYLTPYIEEVRREFTDRDAMKANSF